MISQSIRILITLLFRGRASAARKRKSSYYDHRPLVLAGRLDAALQMLARRSATA